MAARIFPQVGEGRDPGVRLEQPVQVSRAGVRAHGQFRDRPAVGGVPDHQVLRLVDARIDVVAVQEPGRELRVATGPAGVQHQQAGGLERHPWARQLRDQVQRQVHAGGDASAGQDVPVADEIRFSTTRSLGCSRASRVVSVWWVVQV